FTIDLSDLDPATTRLELQCHYQLNEPDSKKWRRIHALPDVTLWEGSGTPPNTADGSLALPLHPIPVDVPLFKTRWRASLVAFIGDKQEVLARTTLKVEHATVPKASPSADTPE